ncbi:hypothetical protein TNCV_1377981 [Trichonephila clavipes]|nr:hypothetical protein TNCV_1377981 [Trichonephila clavipes]
MVLKANDRRTFCPCHDEFRGPRSDYVRQKNPEGPKLTNMVANDAKKVNKLAAHLANKNDANLALPPRFRQVLIESPL